MTGLDICLDGLFAGIAAMGFGAISSPPAKSYPCIAVLAASGHVSRMLLRNLGGIDIVTASGLASVLIGVLALWCSRKTTFHPTSMAIPALLPMVPGTYAYKAVFSIISCLRTLNEPAVASAHLQTCLLNATVAAGVLASIAAGATLVIITGKRLFPDMTRRSRLKQREIEKAPQ